MAAHWRDLVGDVVFHAASTALPRWVNPDRFNERLPNVPFSTARASRSVGFLRSSLTIAARDALRTIERIDNNPRLSAEAKAEDIAEVGRKLWHRVGADVAIAGQAVREARRSFEVRTSARRSKAAGAVIDAASAAELRQLLANMDPETRRATIRGALLDGNDPDIVAALGHAHPGVRRRHLDDADLSEEVFLKVTAAWDQSDPSETYDSVAEADLLDDLDRSFSLGFTVLELSKARLDSSGVPAEDRAEARIVGDIQMGKTAAEIGIETPDPVLPSPSIADTDADALEEPA